MNYDKCHVNADSLKTLFDVRYAVKGCIYRPAEEQTYIYFVDFLDECHG